MFKKIKKVAINISLFLYIGTENSFASYTSYIDLRPLQKLKTFTTQIQFHNPFELLT